LSTYHSEQRRGGFLGWGRSHWLALSIVLIVAVIALVLLLTYTGGSSGGGGGGGY
jgi:hypothetical protein